MTFTEKLATDVLVLDGAMGTQLMVRGASGNNELWGVEHPDALYEIHRGYIEAGAQAILTNTFGGSRLKLERAGLAERTEELNRRLAEIARKAAGDDAWVLGDVGPTGQFVEPYGTLSEAEMIEVFREQIAALVSSGVDGIIIETMMDPTEAVCAIRAAKEVAPELPVLASMTFEKNPQGFRTMMGTSPDEAARRMAEAGADLVGANCGGIAPDDFVPLLQEMRAAVSLPLVVEPNAGLPQLEDGKTVFKETPEVFGRLAPVFREIGARAIGGCCGTTPEHIRAIAEALAGDA